MHDAITKSPSAKSTCKRDAVATDAESHMQVGTVVQAIVSTPRNLQVDDLKQQIAHTTGVPADKLRLVHKGKAIHNDHVVSLSDQGIEIKQAQYMSDGLACFQ